MARFRITAPDGSQFEITAPDNASDADIQSVIQSQFGSMQQPQQAPAPEFTLPIQPTEFQQPPSFQMPTSMLQERLAPDRALSAAIAGQLGGAKVLTQTVDFATANPQLEQQLMQEQIKVGQKPTAPKKGLEIVGETFEQVPIVGEELKKGLEFQAQTPSEQALELASGLVPYTSFGQKNVAVLDEAAKAAKARLQQAEAIDSIATKIRGYTAVPAEFTVASDAVKQFAAQEAKAAQLAAQQPGEKLKKFYEATGFTGKAEIYGAENAKTAKEALTGTIQRRIDRQENRLRQLEVMIHSPGATPEEKQKFGQEFLDTVSKLEENKRKLNEAFDSPAFQSLQESQKHWGEQTIKLNRKEVPVFKQSISRQGVYLPPSEIEELIKPRTQQVNALQRLTMDQPRIMEMMDGNIPNGPMFQLNIRPALDAERAAVNAVNAERSAFNQIAIETGVAKADKKRLAELFKVADGQLDPAVANVTEKEQKFLNYMAGKYNEWLTRINTDRAELGYDLIKARKNYITHISEARLLDDFGIKEGSLDGLQKYGPKLRARFQFEKARLGGQAVQDPLQAFDAYIEPAMRQIHTTKPAAVLQARAKFIPDPALRKMQQNFIETRLLGGLDPKDRTLYEYGLRPAMQLTENLTGRFSGGVILGNAKVILQQFSQFANTVKDTSLKHAMIGLGRAAKEIPPEIASRSDFLTSRRINDDLIDLPKGFFDKPNKFLKKIFEYSDKFVAKQSWQAGFSQAQELGLEGEMAIKYADDVARRLHGSYSKLYKTELNSGKFGKVIAPLQSFGFNLWNYITQDTKLLAEMNDTPRAKELMKTFAAMYVTDEVYEAAGLPSPFGLRVPKALSPEEVALSGREFTMGIVPFGRALEYGIPSPILGQFVKEAQFLTGTGEPRKAMSYNTYSLVNAMMSDNLETRDKAAKELAKFGAQFAPGGSQITKTIEGLKAAKDGYVEFGKQTIMLNDEDRRLAPILGPYAVPSVRKAREQKQLEKFKKQFEVR